MVHQHHQQFVCVLNCTLKVCKSIIFDDDEIIHGVYKRFKNYDLHYSLYITCYLVFGIRIYLHFRDLLRIKCETLPHQELDTCYD